MKTWSTGEIRALARQTVESRKALTTARGQYLKALIETAQSELEVLGGVFDQVEQRRIVSSVNKRFQKIVEEAIATNEILLAAGVARKDQARERNRRLSFVRTNLHAVRSWLRAPGHDLTKLDVERVSKRMLLEQAPPSNKQSFNRKRAQAKADRQIAGLLVFTKQLAKSDQAHAAAVLTEAIDRLAKQLRATVDPGEARSAMSELRKTLAAPKAA